MTGAIDEPGRVLGAEELAYLVGGAIRVAEVAMVGLLAYGRVRTSSEGLLSVVHGPQPPVSRVQQEVLGTIGGGGRPVIKVLVDVARSQEAHRPLAGLEARALIPVRPPRKHRRRRLAVPPPRTPAGEAVVSCAWHLARGGGRMGAEIEGLIDPGLLAWAAGVVAVGGLTAYPDPTVAAVLAAAMERAEAERKSSGSGGCGSYACGSDGGGGGCGGGCGG
jgi:uncharacterized protein (TIGR04222 family)